MLFLGLAAIVFTGTPNTTLSTDPHLVFVKEENNVYTFEGTKTIYFGCISSAAKTNGTYCRREDFEGDPCYSDEKVCYSFEGDALIPCANEGGACLFGGTKTIYFGLLTWKDETNGCMCTDAIFGDPAPGVTKSCYIRSDQAHTD